VRVLVTGHRGYIGSVLTAVLHHTRHDVIGLDCDLYTDADFGRTRDDVPSFDIDVRDVEFTDLLSFDAVIHLASLPEDFENRIDSDVADAINTEATVRLAECCKKAQVARMLFASSCAVYGFDGGELLTERSPTAPISRYAAGKLAAERELASLADTRFHVVLLRNATVYGVSPRMRLDTVVNDFVASAVARGRIDMRTNGAAWRPLMHVEDLCRAYAAVLMAPDRAVAGQIFNVVDMHANHRIIDVADQVLERVPYSGRSVADSIPDRRSYRVDGSYLTETFPNLTWRWNLDRGIAQVRDALDNAGITSGDWRSHRFRRLDHLLARLERGDLDTSLRPKELPPTSKFGGIVGSGTLRSRNVLVNKC